MSKFERLVQMSGAYDKRNPDPKKNYGIHGMDLRFVLKGDKGATQFVVYTSMHLPHVAEEMWRRGGEYNPFKPMGADIGYHAKVPQYSDQPIAQHECEYVGGPCYYDGTSLGADEFMPEFLEGGSEAVWNMLERRYNETFGEESAP